MATNKELLDDISFDRKVAPKDQISNLLVSLIKKKAFDENTAIELSKYNVKAEELDTLIKNGRVEIFSKSPTKIYLTELGKLVALGELSIRKRE